MAMPQSFFARQARNLMRKPLVKPVKPCLDANRLEDRVTPAISGFAFIDYNANGAFDTTTTIANLGGTPPTPPGLPQPPGAVQTAVDVGLANVTVRVFNAAGVLVDTQTTAANGTWASNTAPGQYRVEYSGLATGFALSPHGPDNRTATQFVTDGATNVNLGAYRALDYFSANPQLVTQVYNFGGQDNNRPVLQSFPYNAGTASIDAQSTEAINPTTHALSITARDIGTTWGIAYNRPLRELYASSFTKRHSNWASPSGANGAGGPGFIYRTALPTTQANGTLSQVTTATTWINLDGLTALVNGVPTLIDTVPAAFDAWAANRIGQTSQAYWEEDGGDVGWNAVGKTGLGGLSVSDNGQFVYVMNLGDRRLYQIPVLANGAADTANIRGFDLPSVAGVANQNDIRPFAVEFNLGVVYIGLVNSAESTPGVPANQRGYVYSFDPATGAYSANSLVNDSTGNGFRLDYERGLSFGGQDEFRPWSPTVQSQQVGGGSPTSPTPLKFPQAMLSGITFDNNNNLIISLRDRAGDQSGDNIRDRPGDISYYEGISAGDTLMAFANTIGGSAGWTVERNGSSPVAGNPATGFSGTAFNGQLVYGPNDNQGPVANPALPPSKTNPGGEFFGADFFGNGTHTETSSGSAVHVPGFPDVVSTGFDPIPINGQVRTGGTRWFNTYTAATGATGDGRYAKGYQLYTQTPSNERSLIGANFGKANGVGDLVAFATELPPIEIGNRIFADADRDGIQDAAEVGIGGVTVELWATGGLTPLATAVTAADGTYYFNSGIDPNSKVNPTNEVYGIAALLAGQTYEVRIPNASGGAQQGALGGQILTTFNVQTPAYAGDTEQNQRNSDAQINGTVAVIQVAANGLGQSNHTYDAGFAPGVSLGNLVWEDANNDGVFQIGETPLANVPVRLFFDSNGDGVPDTALPAFSTQTDANGLYLFDGLSPDKYVVEITSPTGYRSSSGTTFDPINGPFESGLLVNSNTDNIDHGVTLSGSLETGFLIRTRTVTLGQPGDKATNPGPGGNSNLSQDFGLYRSYSVGNQVFTDSNNDGLFNGDSVGINGVSVRLYAPSAFNGAGQLIAGSQPLVANAITAGGGFYRFDNLIAGDYVVVVDGASAPLANLRSSTGGTSTSTLYEPAPNAFPATSKGNNADNGTTLTGNLVRTGVVTLGPGANEPLNEVNLVAGPDPQGSPDAQADMTVDFGFYQPLSLGNQIFNDANNDGLLNNGEVGLVGVGVDLFLDLGNGNLGLVASQSTIAGGYYLFTGLGAGNYVVRVSSPTLPAGFVTSTGKNGSTTGPNEPAPGFVINQADGVDRGSLTGGFVQSKTIAISAGNAPLGAPATPGFIDTVIAADSYRIVDFGFFNPLSLGSLVWNDLDNNGKFNGAEVGIDGLGVNLYFDANSSGTFDPAFDPLVSTQLTKSGGQYLFTNLATGGYFVEVAAAGFKSSTGAPGQPTGPYEPGIAGITLADDNQDHGTNATNNGIPVVQSKLVSLQVGGNPNIAPIFGDTTVDGNRNYTVDFGLFTSLSLGNFVWNDSNNDGKFNGLETGLPNVAVELLVGGNVVKTTATNSDGNYLFSDLTAGTYTVRITAPTGFISSTGTNGSPTGPYEPVSVIVGNNEDHGSTIGAFVTAAPVTLVATSNLEQDFGLFQPLALGDQVWVDANNNGLFDNTEVGLANVPVTLLDSTGTVTISSTTTGADGTYLFTNLVQGTYIVNIAPGAGYQSSTGTNGSTSGPFEPANLITANNQDHGTKFDAANIRSTAVLTAAGTNTENAGFANLRQDFGVYQPLSLGNFVFNDLDNNGKFDGTDVPLANVPVTLLDGTGATVGVTATTVDGIYGFANLVPGSYTVRVTPPTNFATSTGKNGSASGPYEPGITANIENEDHGSRNGQVVDAKATLVAPGGNPSLNGFANLTQDFALYQPISVGSFVWIDANNNGKFDPGEQPLGSVPVTLLDGNKAVIATTTTDAGGKYNFTDLTPGTYFVAITPPAGVLPSSSSVNPLASPNNVNVGTAGPNGTVVSAAVDLTLGGAAIFDGNTANQFVTFDFGLVVPAPVVSKLSGFVYFDPNIDGQFTPGINGDRAFGGVVVTLTGVDANGGVLPTQKTTTDKTGFYQFTNLLPGTYTVRETQPSGQYYDGLDTPGSIPGSTTPSNDVIVVPLPANANSVNNNFGEIPPAYVMGYVWVDINNNCQKDPVEVGVGNVPITITGTSFAGSPLSSPLTPITIFTDASGYYAFPVLPPGIYAISRGDLPAEVRNVFANSCLQIGDPGPNPPTPGNQQFTNVQLGTPVRGPFNFGVIPIDPSDPSKRNFLGSSSNNPTAPNAAVAVGAVGGPTRATVSLNPTFATTTGNPLGNSLVVIGTGVGQRAVVRVLDYAVGAEKYRFEPYGAYVGGVRVAQGDVDGDGVNDIVTATGQGGGPRIRVFSGATGEAIRDFFAYESTFRGGVFVAAADIDGDGRAEIITGTELGGGPRVRVFNGGTGAIMQDFFAFDPNQRGGVRVAAADFNGDGKADIVTTTGASVPTRVRVFNGQNVAIIQDYTPFGSSFSGGATLGVGDVNGDGQADVLVGTEAGGGPRVQIFDGATQAMLFDFFAFDGNLRSGVRVAAQDIDGDGKAEVVVTAGASGAARVRILRTSDFTAVEDFFALDPEFRGGAYVG